MAALGSRKKGLVLSSTLGLLALFLGKVFPVLGSSMVALFLGMVLANTWRLPTAYQAGLAYSSKYLLQYAIVLLGFGLPLAKVSAVGLASLPLTLLTIGVAFFVALVVGRLVGLNQVLRTLIGFGTAICGGSAIMAASPILEAETDEVALSMSTIFFFNLLAILFFPLLGQVLQLSATDFGLWVGTAVNDTSSVVAVGYQYSQEAGDYATIVKLARSLMIVPACLILALLSAYQAKKSQLQVKFRKIFPWFIAWFSLASLLSSYLPLPSFILSWLQVLSRFLMATALAAIGCKVSFQQFRQAGLAPLLTGLLTWLAVALSSLLCQLFIF